MAFTILMTFFMGTTEKDHTTAVVVGGRRECKKLEAT